MSYYSIRVQDAAFAFFLDFTLPPQRNFRREVLEYLTNVFAGAAALPKDLKDLDFWALERASIKGYQALLFDEKLDRVPQAYARAHLAFKKLSNRS